MPRKQKKYHYIYKTTCQVTGKFYVGMHSTNNLEDGYLGSGKILGYSIGKHGRENHKLQILEFCETRDELKKREAELVNEELLADPLNINLKYGGEGGWTSNASIKGNRSTKRNTLVLREKLKDQTAREEFSRKISIANKASYENGRLIAGCFADNSEVIKRAWSNGAKEKRSETRLKNKFQQGENNSQFGTKWAWVTSGSIVKKIKLEFLEDYLQQGYRRGKKLG